MHGARRFVGGFIYALRGAVVAYVAERNLRVHALAAYLALSVAFAGGVDATGRAVVVVTAASVWSAELLNSALERSLDRQSRTRDPLAREAKDAAAGAVLSLAVAAVAVAALVLVPVLPHAWAVLRGAPLLARVLWTAGAVALCGATVLPRRASPGDRARGQGRDR